MFRENLKMSWMNVIHNKLRSALTILGIVIGVGSIIALITIGKSSMSEMTNEFTSFGADKITVQVTGTPLKQGLIDNDIEKLQQIENVAGISPTLTGNTTIVASGVEKTNVIIQGKNDVYFSKTPNLLENGRGINLIDIESENRVSLIGSDIAKDLFFQEDPIGKELIINGVGYQIIGTLKESSSFSNSSMNDAVIVPYTTSMSLLGTGYVSTVDVFMENSRYSDQITEDIQVVLNEAFNDKKEGFTIINMQDMLSSINKITNMLSLMLGGIGSIALFVGGIGIMNMMLVSVTERTTEIGLRKALGAEPKRIQQQFLIEAVFLSLIGGVLGFFGGVGVSYVVCLLMGTKLVLTISTVLLALGFSGAVGIIFGIAPARKASRLSPIDALRSA
jgi:putative ABC transport system permease protein